MEVRGLAGTGDGCKLRVKHYAQAAGESGTLRVDPGKAHFEVAYSEIPGLPRHHEQPLLRELPWLAPGYCMARWREAYRQAAGGELRDVPIPRHQAQILN